MVDFDQELYEEIYIPLMIQKYRDQKSATSKISPEELKA